MNDNWDTIEEDIIEEMDKALHKLALENMQLKEKYIILEENFNDLYNQYEQLERELEKYINISGGTII